MKVVQTYLLLVCVRVCHSHSYLALVAVHGFQAVTDIDTPMVHKVLHMPLLQSAQHKQQFH
jgi:hypothetical protein